MPKTWLVTGAAGGLGQELTRAAVHSGDRVMATDLDLGALEAVTREYGDRVRTRVLDVTDSSAAAAAVAATVAELGSLDVVVNNAGHRGVGSIEDMPEDEFRRHIEINLFGVVNVSRAALPVLRSQRSGHVFQISTIGGRRAQPGIGAYQTSKWAVGGFSEILAKELAPVGVHVTLVELGGLRTAWAQTPIPMEEVREEYRSTVGRFAATYNRNPDVQRGDPAKIAQVVVALTDEPDPPVRLLIGSDSAWLAPRISAARAAEDEKWRHVSVSTDFDGLGDFADTEVARMVRP
ncbi:SDR family NAD(P)-dependent oxidoreductase [Amycolatopsis rhabdoformis]|uniref:SDR family NAD(P)-dependent oxidoreductase n=1 Tax=Amycolatopsis rhabdoformis TaxID=1448059 RepID=A0ABZ1IF08_9PSEU|nr:SDR family NAD(P)-dependent oxidoreductase [Amycolatopsis rhabdoformis]WSE32238.1 SDR family NAD(P)-dependent oxidoreductase [Amycolatopsis rhabdoformis]